MKDCIVMKLKAAVNNDNLPYFNKIVIKSTDLLTKQGSVQSLTVGQPFYFINSTTGTGNRTYNQLIPVSIGETIAFSGIDNIFGSYAVNIRLMLFDNANNYTITNIVNNNPQCPILDTSLYNYNNTTKRTFTIPNTQVIQEASKPTLVVVFMVGGISGDLGTGDITIDLSYA